MEITQHFTRPRKDFGRETRFTTENAQMLADIRPNEERAKAFVVSNHISMGVQAGPLMSEHEVSTEAVVLVNKGMWHIEGGWPKDLDCTEQEQTARFIRKVEKDEHYIKTILGLCAVAEEIVKQNNAIDIYEEYWADDNDVDAADLDTEAATMSTISQLRPPFAAGQHCAAHNASWHPDGSHKIAVALCTLTGEPQAVMDNPLGDHLSSYVWDLQDPNTPEHVFTPSSPILSLHFSPKDSKILGAGHLNGQFAIYDTRRGVHAVDTTPVERCHRDPVYDFAWVQSKTGTETMTISSDGRILWWDVRRLAEPTDELVLHNKLTDGRYGALSLSYNPAVGATRFMVGTEDGCILTCNKAKGQGDRISATLDGHHGGICGLERNPFHPKYFLSCGDWTTRMWNEDLRTPIFGTPYMQANLTSLCWSTSRPSVYFTARADGIIDAWDIPLHGTRKPSLSYQVAKAHLTSITGHASGRYVASGCMDGSVYVMSIGTTLTDPLPNEKSIILQVLEAETMREKNIEKAQKEAKVRARKEGAKSIYLQDVREATLLDDAQVEEDFAAALSNI